MYDAGLTLAIALAAGVLAQSVSRQARLPGIVLLLATGAVLGPEGAGWVDPDALGDGVFGIVDFGIAIILFEGGLNLEWSRLKRQEASIRRLITVGAAMTFAGAAALARLAMDWSWDLSLLFGSLVVVTGPTVVAPLLRDMRLQPRLRTILERRGVNRDGLTRQPAGLDESLLHPRKDGPVRLQIDQAPRARNRRMIGWRLVHGQPQKAADRQRVRRAPRNPAFRVDAFEGADQQQAEVAPGCQARSAHHGRVEPVTQAFDEPIDVVPVEQRRQPRVERMARRGGQVRRRDPQRRLIRLARSHSHARQCSTTDRLCRSLITPTFTTGC